MNAKDISKELGISRKWLDKFSKEKHEELGDKQKFLDWDKYLPEIKERWASEHHNIYKKQTYIKMLEHVVYRNENDDYDRPKRRSTRTLGYYSPEETETLKEYIRRKLYLKPTYIEALQRREKKILEYAHLTNATNETINTAKDFFLIELANQNCLVCDFDLISMNRSEGSIRGFDNKITSSDFNNYIENDIYDCEYVRAILDIRKKLNIELDDAKIEVDKKRQKEPDDDYLINPFENMEFRYNSSKSIMKTLKRLKDDNSIDAFFNSYLDFLKRKYNSLQLDHSILSKDYQDYDLKMLRKEIVRKLDNTLGFIDKLHQEIAHEYDRIKTKAENKHQWLVSINNEIKECLKQEADKKKELWASRKENKKEDKKENKEENSTRKFISDNPDIINIRNSLKILREKKFYLSINNTNLPELYEKTYSNIKELSGLRKILEEIDRLIALEAEIHDLENMIQELDKTWSFSNRNNEASSQDYRETIEKLAEMRIKDIDTELDQDTLEKN